MQVFENILEEMTKVFKKIMSWRIIFSEKKIIQKFKRKLINDFS
jgi:hypothetical protein